MHIRNSLFVFLSGIAVSLSAFAADWPTDKVGAKPLWDAATDPATQSRFIPMQLIVPALWDGTHQIDLPNAASIDAEGTSWTGPQEWRHPYTEKTLLVYHRQRSSPRDGTVVQKMAVRDDGTAIGRAYDSRFGEHVCAQEAKFPLGVWKEGEVRTFDYPCFKTRDGKVRERQSTTRITIEELDYEYLGVPHSLRFSWQLSDTQTNEVRDHRIYIFSPGKGLAYQRRR